MKKCKITVLKRMFDEELKEQYIKFDDFGLCPFMKEGDVFITGGHFGNECPEGFCPMAWQAICIQASTLAGGGKVYGVDDVHIACCNDGVRPVIFKLEMIEEENLNEKETRKFLDNSFRNGEIKTTGTSIEKNITTNEKIWRR